MGRCYGVACRLVQLLTSYRRFTHYHQLFLFSSRPPRILHQNVHQVSPCHHQGQICNFSTKPRLRNAIDSLVCHIGLNAAPDWYGRCIYPTSIPATYSGIAFSDRPCRPMRDLDTLVRACLERLREELCCLPTLSTTFLDLVLDFRSFLPDISASTVEFLGGHCRHHCPRLAICGLIVKFPHSAHTRPWRQLV